MRLFHIYLVFVLILFSCENKSINALIPNIPIDTTKSDREDVIDALPSLALKLGLAPLDNLVDSFTYRFWLPIEKDSFDGMTIIDISYIRNEWKATQIDFWGHNPEHQFKRRDTVNYFLKHVVDSFKKKDVFPNVLLDSLVALISKLDLQNGPLQFILDSNNYDSNSSRYLEFANSRSYRAIHIACKSGFTQIPFNLKVMELEKLLIKHLGLDVGGCIKYYHKSINPDPPPILRPNKVANIPAEE